MPGTAAFPEIDDAVSTVNGGHDDDVKSTVGSKISAAKFVDNSIHHATYEISTHSSGRYMTVGRPSSSDFQVTHERLYDFEEEEESLLLTHTTAPGVKDDVPVFFTDNRLQTGVIPPLILYTKNKKIRPHSITTTSKGSRVNLRGLQGKPLDIGSGKMRGGQPIDIGLRSTDLVSRLFQNKQQSLNSISIGRPFLGPNTEEVTTYKGASISRHSRRFLSANFISDNLPEVIRFIARHDNYMIYCDRFGNFIYCPNNFQIRDRTIETVMAESIDVDSISDVANRIIVKGRKMVMNPDNEAILDDIEMQEQDGIIKTSTITDPTAITRTAARRFGNEYLRLNRRAQGSIKTKDHIKAWDLYPADVITFVGSMVGSQNMAVIEVQHRLHTGTSDFQLLSYESGVERLLQDHSSKNLKDSGDYILTPMTQIESGGGDRTKMRVYALLGVRHVAARLPRIYSDPSDYNLDNTDNDIHSGFMIGHRNYDTGNANGRSAIGTGLTPRLAGGSHSGGTITVSSTTGFPSAGYLIINETIHVQYTGKTGTTFTGVTVQAPSGATIPGSGLSVRLFRTRGHEMRTLKGSLRIGRL